VSGRILVVEDNPANLELMSYLLRAAGHEVVEASSATDAEQRARAHHLDLIVVDIELPDMTGYELLGRLRADSSWSPAPAVAVTAHAMANDQGRASAAGFVGYFVKPIDPRTFAAAIADLLPAPAARSETEP
jgi:two-component system, cell cycle response regulator DivK